MPYLFIVGNLLIGKFEMLILLRHATPVIDYDFCDYEGAKNRVIAYNSTSQINTNEMDGNIDEIRCKAEDSQKTIVYTSGLPRSQKTAEYIFNSSDIRIINNPIFSEFDLNILKIPFIKLPTKTWFLISRLAWFLGINLNASSFTTEKKRARAAAELLETHLIHGSTVILVGHGLINKFIENHFKKLGWVIEKGTKNGSFEIKTIKKLIY